MTANADAAAAGVEALDCLTPFGDAAATAAALLAGRRALAPHPVLGPDGGDPVPLALIGGAMDEPVTPRWLAPARELARRIPAGDWGSAREPVVVTSSNFGVGAMHAFTRDRDARHLAHGTPFAAAARLGRELGWGEHVHVLSHACVTAHLGLALAGRLLHRGFANRVLVFSFDFVSPFVAAGFHSLKILNAAMPAPFAARDSGSIGLGDGAAFAVLAAAPAPLRLEAAALHNEMHHFTSNRPDGAGFTACAVAMAAAARGRRVWIKGHGTGTLEAGRLEAEAWRQAFPDAPLVSWKGSLGHTLGSCGLVELAVAAAALRAGRIPGTVGGEAPSFTANVALGPLAAAGFDAAVLSANAFGGAHASFILAHD
ncbi:MAG TPA: hypothetical protein VEB66_08240 [Opitutaceae bacterium]|nr:hypothetical protein [Opitutaceae bacterium]